MKNEITDEQLIAYIEGSENQMLTELIQSDEEMKKRHDQLKEVIGLMEEDPE